MRFGRRVKFIIYTEMKFRVSFSLSSLSPLETDTVRLSLRMVNYTHGVKGIMEDLVIRVYGAQLVNLS